MRKKLFVVTSLIGIFWTTQVSAVILTQWGTAVSTLCQVNLKCKKTNFKFTSPIITDLKAGGSKQKSSEMLNEAKFEGKSTFKGLNMTAWLLAVDSGFYIPRSAASISELLLQLTAYPVIHSFNWEDFDSDFVEPKTPSTKRFHRLNIPENDADQFYLQAGLVAETDVSDENTNAFNTLELSFNSTQITPATAALPMGHWVLGSALAGLMCLSRRMHPVSET